MSTAPSSSNGPLILNDFPALASLNDSLNAIDHSSNKQKHLYNQQQQQQHGPVLNSSLQVNQQQSQSTDASSVVNSNEATTTTSVSVVKGKGKSIGRKGWKVLQVPIMPRDPNDKDRDIRGDKATSNYNSKYSKGNKNRSRNSSSYPSSSSGVNHSSGGGASSSVHHHHPPHGHPVHHSHPHNSTSSAQSISSEADGEHLRANASRRNGPSNFAGPHTASALINSGPGANLNAAIVNSVNGGGLTGANAYAAVVGGGGGGSSTGSINATGPATLMPVATVVTNAGATGLVINPVNSSAPGAAIQDKRDNNAYRQANAARRGGKYSQRPRANSPQRSSGKNEFRRNELPNNIGLSTSIASVVTPNGSGRATPVANGGVPVVEEFPPDIQYYVDFAPIGDPSLTPTKAAVLSPVIPGVPGTAIVPTPAYALSAPPPAATSNLAPFYTPAVLSTVAFAPPLAPVSNATVSVTPTVVPPNVTFAALSPPDPEDLKDKIRHQIEYYFSEENLVKDVFIRKKMDSDGYLPISLIASFHRVASLTQDVNMIISALKDSLSVELSESQLKARPRNHPKSWPMSDKPSSSTNPTSPSSSITATAPSNSSSSPSSSLSNVNGTSNQTVNSATDASSREFVTSNYQLTSNTTTTTIDSTAVAAAVATDIVAASETASSPAPSLPPSVLDSVSTAASTATVVSTNEIINDTVETATAAAASVTAASTSVNVVATSSGSTTNDSLNATSPANKSPRQQDTNVVGGNSELHADVPSFVPGKPYNVTTTSDSSP